MFLLSPLLSIPFVLGSVYNKSKGGLLLFSLLLGLFSALYHPQAGDDKTAYYEFFERVQGQPIEDVLIYISLISGDFAVYLLMYVFANLGLPLRVLFFIISTSTIYLWLKVFYELIGKKTESRVTFFIFFLSLVLSISLPGYLSGIRFYFSLSICLYAYYLGFFQNKRRKGLFLLFAAVLTHVSSVVLVILYLVGMKLIAHEKWVKNLFLFSFILMLVPREFLLDITQALAPSELLQLKAESYLGGEEYLEISLASGNLNNRLKYLFKTLWIFPAYAYVFLTWRLYSPLRALFFINMALCHVLYSAPTIYNRFLIFAQVFFLLLFMWDWIHGVQFRKIGALIIVVLFLNFSGNVLAMRKSFGMSYMSIECSSLYHIVAKQDFNSAELLYE